MTGSGLRRRAAAAACAAAAATGLGGCGGEDAERAVRDLRARVEREVDARVARARASFERARARFEQRAEEILGDLRQAVPQAQATPREVRARGRTSPTTIDAFMTDVLENIDDYWVRTFRAGGLPEPQVRFTVVPAGARLRTGCGTPADDDAAFYCPADDTIYVAAVFASAVYDGVIDGLPGQRAGFGRAGGDFAVAYVLAHEYAHNLQQELGIFDTLQATRARPFELHADCWSGTWANSVFRQGLLEPGDLQEALDTALAVGDFDFGDVQHHGTPQERRAALLEGYRSGDPQVCSDLLPQV